MAALDAGDLAVEELVEDPAEQLRIARQAELGASEVETHLLAAQKHPAGFRREVRMSVRCFHGSQNRAHAVRRQVVWKGSALRLPSTSGLGHSRRPFRGLSAPQGI